MKIFQKLQREIDYKTVACAFKLAIFWLKADAVQVNHTHRNGNRWWIWKNYCLNDFNLLCNLNSTDWTKLWLLRCDSYAVNTTKAIPKRSDSRDRCKETRATNATANSYKHTQFTMVATLVVFSTLAAFTVWSKPELKYTQTYNFILFVIELLHCSKPTLLFPSYHIRMPRITFDPTDFYLASNYLWAWIIIVEKLLARFLLISTKLLHFHL